MSIIIVDNFQVDINNPIDNRFVVGSQSLPNSNPSLYPTPFYKYKEDIIYKYPGLRIWDFNVNVPYVWDGTQWINENTTGALVENAATGNTGFENYVVKFANNQTLLTKSLLFDNLSHIGLGLTTPSPGSTIPGLHVSGNIRTNNNFVGNGSLITNIHAPNITTGYLSLARITPPNPFTPGLTYLLKNISGVTTWDLLTTIMPFTSASNLTLSPTTAAIANLSTGNVYQGISIDPLTGEGTLQFKQLVSTGLQIDDNTDDIRIESKAGVTFSGVGIEVYDGLDSDYRHKFKKITSDSLAITENSGIIKVEVPATFEGTDYYVNALYPGTEELGTRSKPFKSIKACLDKILNRANPGITPPIIPNPAINGGNPIEKWQNLNPTRVVIQSFLWVEENLAINSVTYFLEKGGYSSHLYIPDTTDGNNLEWMFDMKPLVTGALADTTFSSSGPAGPGQFNHSISCKVEGNGTLTFHSNHPKRKGFFRAVGSNSYDYNNVTLNSFIVENGCSLTVGSVGGSILLQMDRLPQGVDISYGTTPPQNKVVRFTITLTGNPTTGTKFTHDILLNGESYSDLLMLDKTFNSSATINSNTQCPLGTSTAITLSNLKSNLELFNRDPYITYSTNGSNQLYIDLTTLNSNTVTRNTTTTAPISFPLTSSTTFSPSTTVNYTALTDEDNVPIYREGTQMFGHITTFTPDYGVIHVEGRNLPYRESLFLNGSIEVNSFEQHMIYLKNYAGIYSDNGRIYMRRSYQRVIYSKVKYIPSSWSYPITDTGAGTYYEIVTLGNTNNWHLLGISGTWRDSDGNTISNPVNNAAVRIGYIFKRNSTTPTLSSGTHGEIVQTRKVHLPCNHVYDVYLKDGSSFSHGGDFYTQQNTGQSAGGADSFVFLENNNTGTNTYDQYNGKMCSFSANGGGFVTNLFYNNYIKVSYNISHNNPYISHQVNFKSLKLNSQPWGYLIKAVNSAGSSVKFTLYGFSIINSYMSDYYWYGNKRLPFTNISIKPGLLWVDGTNIELSGGTIFNTTIPEYGSNAVAKTQLSIGMLYRESVTGNLKFVIP